MPTPHINQCTPRSFCSVSTHRRQRRSPAAVTPYIWLFKVRTILLAKYSCLPSNFLPQLCNKCLTKEEKKKKKEHVYYRFHAHNILSSYSSINIYVLYVNVYICFPNVQITQWNKVFIFTLWVLLWFKKRKKVLVIVNTY